MDPKARAKIEAAKEAALEVLLYNRKGPYHSLPRTAAWGYPEPYTRDLMISSLGLFCSENKQLVESVRNTLLMLAKNQSPRGHIPSLVHEPRDLGSSDSTPLFLIVVSLYRSLSGKPKFLQRAVEKALSWMEHQSPTDSLLVGQLPTSDWRDEQWVLGYGLYVNALVHTYLRLLGRNKEAKELRRVMHGTAIYPNKKRPYDHDGLGLPQKSYYAMWSYKIYYSDRFDLLGNSLAILSGVASRSRAKQIIRWVETRCRGMRKKHELAGNLPPCLFPYIGKEDADWRARYDKFNRPGQYHNGGIWPFICGFYIAAVVAIGDIKLAEKKLLALTELVQKSRRKGLKFGFNEWYWGQSSNPGGQDWQTWSASMYLYAACCVEKKKVLFFDNLRATN